ncbi:hypothetical protein BDF20DRAFT_808469, partial [Mycotypha africana]|uniref:uncharacterized protein n=1 Tax=Mycotypha africana TaxID=64632 RepID=UPI002300CF5F
NNNDKHRPLIYRSPADKQRIEYEKTTLSRLRRALDTVITERMAHSRPVVFHEVQNTLKNSTNRSITLTHVAQIMYVAPTLYLVQAKEIRDYMGRAKEAHVIECGVDWVVPLSAKDFVKRADLLAEAVDKYFRDHPEADAVIPQASLPSIKLLTDKDEWKKSDNLPPGVKAILAAQEKAKQEEEEAKKPKPKRTGTVAERMAALKARVS